MTKRLLLIALLVIVPAGHASAAPASKFEVRIMPIGCQSTIIDTGPSQTQQLSPAVCHQVVPSSPDTDKLPTENDALEIPVPGLPIISPSSSEQKPAVSDILLNDFADYLDGSGYRLALKLGQAVHFLVGTESHSVTVKEIGSDYVVLTIASTPFNTTLYVGNQNQYDVTGDGSYDLEITLHSIANKVANLTFRQLQPQTFQTSPTQATKDKTSWWQPIAAGSGVIGVSILYKRGYLPKAGKRRKSPRV
jgi:hypothetical protein